VRIAIIGTCSVPLRWQADCVRRLLDLDGLECVLGLVEKVGSPPGQRILSLLGRYLFPRCLLSARTAMPISKLRTSDFTAQINSLKDFGPDIILYLGTGEPDDKLLEIPPQGVWSFQIYGRSGCNHSWLAWLRQIGDAKTIIATLGAKGGAHGDGNVLRSGCFRIKSHGIGSSVDTLLTTIATWPSDCCARQLKGIKSNHFSVDENSESQISDGPNSGLWQFCKILGRLSLRLFKRLFEEEQWGVGIVDRPVNAFLDNQPLNNIRWLASPGSPRFIADPFGIIRDGVLHVFHERLDAGARKGVIAWYEMNSGDQSTSSSTDVIRQDVHLSYPFLLHHDGKDYCVPESAAAGEVAIYEAVEFPNQWRKVAVLLEQTKLIDPTLFEHDGRWWMFGTGVEDGGMLALQIWYADHLFGPWRPHCGNPVKIDVRSARPAGTPFFHEGHWYRPAQDCSRTYGGRVVINRIDSLNLMEFQEQVVATVDPMAGQRYRDGIHTLSAIGKNTLIDGKQVSYSLAGFWRRCLRSWA